VKVLKQEALMHFTTNSPDWSDDKIGKLRRLWDEGLPAAEIGRRLGTTKNAVIGKAWRFELPPRRVSVSPNLVPSLAEIMPLATDRCHWPFGKPGTAASGSAINRSSPANPTAKLTVASPTCART
jgi:GcrA cell cycle regulator